MIRRRLLVRLIVALGVIVGGLASFPGSAFPDEPFEATLSLTKSTNVSSVRPGVPFDYTIAYSCSAGAGGCDNVVVTDVVPPQLSRAAADVAVIPDQHTIAGGATYDPLTGTATWTLDNPLPSGSSGELRLRVEFPDTAVNGTEADNEATITATNAEPENAIGPTVTADVLEQVTAKKTLTSPQFILGVDATYNVTWTNTGDAPLSSPELVDTLPEGAVFVSAPATINNGVTVPAGVRSTTSDGRTLVTWHLIPNPAPPGTTITMPITVNYPNGPPFAPLGGAAPGEPVLPIVNAVTAYGTAPSGMTVSDPATVENTPLPPDPRIRVTKVIGGTQIGPNIMYTLTITNTGTVTLNNVRVSDVLPPGAVWVSCYNTTGCHVAPTPGDPDPPTNTVTWDAVSSLAPAASFTRYVIVFFPPSAFSPGDVAHNVANVVATPSTGGDDKTDSYAVNTTLTALTATRGAISKAPSPNLGAAYIFLDVPQQFCTTVSNNSGEDWTDFTLTDPLPTNVLGEKATFLSATNGGVLNAAEDAVVWKASFPAGTTSVNFCVTLEFPSDLFGDPSDLLNGQISNCATASAYLPNGDPVNWNGSPPGTSCYARPPAPFDPEITVSKRATVATVPVGESDTYTVTGTNTGNVPLQTFYLTDVLPSTLQFDARPATNITVAVSSGNTYGYIQYHVAGAAATTFTTLLTCGNTAPTCTAKVPTTNTATPPAKVDQVRFQNLYTTTLNYSVTLTLTLRVPPTTAVMNGDSIDNCAMGTAVQFAGPPTLQPPGIRPSQDCSHQTAAEPPPVMTLSKSRSVPAAPPGATVTWSLPFGTSVNSLAPVRNPVVTDCLPPGLDLVDPAHPEFPVNGSPPASFVTADGFPTITRVVNAPGCDPGVEIKWSWAGANPPLIVPIGQTGTFTLNTEVQAGTPQGLLTNNASAVAENQPTPVTATATVEVTQGASLDSVKLVKGSLNTDYATLGLTTLDGRANYKLTVENFGNVPLRNVTVMDILPWCTPPAAGERCDPSLPGDRRVLPPFGPRGSTWSPVMAAGVTVTPPPGSSPSDVQVSYSTSHNPCRNPALNLPPGTDSPLCDQNSFSSTVPPLDTVAALMFVLPGPLEGGQSFTMEWPMTTPINAPVPDFAWNSFAVTAVNSLTSGQLPAAEPNNVGFETQPYPITLTKRVNGSVETTRPGKFIAVGRRVTYTYVISNPANLEVAGLDLVDHPAQTILCDGPNGTQVPPAEAVVPPAADGVPGTLTCHSHAGRARRGEHTDFATVTGQPRRRPGEIVGERTPVATAHAHYFGARAHLTVEKLVNGLPEPSRPGQLVPGGSTVTFTYNITNTGNVTLDPVSLTDEPPRRDITCNATVLAPRQSTTCTSSVVASPGQVTNTATATGQGVDNTGKPIGRPATGTDVGNRHTPNPEVTTTVRDYPSLNPFSPGELTGSRAVDMAAVMTVGIVPTGTVTYRFRTGDCTTGSTVFRHTVTLTGTGRVPHSRPTGRLAGGDYSFQATYHGGAHIGTATSDCEKFTVRRADATVATTVFNHATGQPWLGEEGIGSRAFDTADVTGVVEGFTPTGSVTYHLFANPYCSGRAVSTETVDLKPDGSVPDSAPTRPLRPGQYSFLAAYNGDRNYTADTAGCEIFVVMPPEVPEVIPPPAEPGTPPPPPGEPALAPPVADLVLSKRVDRSIARQGQPLRYTLTVTNHGPDTATNVRLTDTPRLPLLTISIHPGQGHCRIGPPLTCELGTLRPGARVTVTITAVPILVGKRGNKAVVMNNTGVVMSDIHDPKPSNNVAGSVTAIRSAPAPAPPPFTG